MPLELIDENDELMFAIALDELERQRKEIEKNPNQVNTLRFWENESLLMLTAFAAGIFTILERSANRSFEVLNTSGVLDSIQDIIASVDTERIIADIGFVSNQTAFTAVRDITEVTRAQLQDLFARSIEEGLSSNQLADLLTPIFGEKRAKNIAISESTRAHARGNAIVAEELRNSGFVVNEIWNTVQDGRVCQICAPLEGTVRGVSWNILPYDGSHIGCRCFITNEVVEI